MWGTLRARVHSGYVWGYSVALVVSVPAEATAPPGALDAIEQHDGEELTELDTDWALVTPPDGSDSYYWHRPSSATQYECPWVSRTVAIEASSTDTVFQTLDAISEKMGAEVGENYALVYAGSPLPESDLLSAHFPEQDDDGVDGSLLGKAASFYCHLQDVEAARQAKVQANIQLIHAISRFKALGKQAREGMVDSMATHRAARVRAVTRTEILREYDASCDRELQEVEQQIAELEAGQTAGGADASISAAQETEPWPEPEPAPGPVPKMATG
jgi:hypothetical protein